MNLVILSASSQGYRPVSDLTIPNKKEYGYRHDVEVRLVTQEPNGDKGWGRIDLLLEHLPTCDWLLFMGADTLFMDLNKDARAYCIADADIAVTIDSMGFQSDVMFIRNCEVVIRLLEAVRDARKTDFDLPYHMAACEQGALVRLLAGRHSYSDCIPCEDLQAFGARVKCIGPEINSYWDTFRIGDFIFHAPGMPIDDKVRQIVYMLKHVRR